MPLQKHLRFLLGLLYAALALGAAALLLPGLLPFLLGWSLSRLLEGPVRFLEHKARLRRSWTSAAVLLLFLVFLTAGGFFLFRRLWYEVTALSALLPALMELIQELLGRLNTLIYRWTVAVSPQLRSALQNAVVQVSAQVGTLLSTLGENLLARCANVLLGLPKAVLFLFTALLSGYFFLATRPGLSSFRQRRLPPRWQEWLDRAGLRLKRALGGWLRAQGILMAVTFVLLCAGFLLMGVEPALLLAAGVALLDALPVFGTGTVLLPWALLCILTANPGRAIALCVLYMILWLTRSLLEPRLIADRAGLHPLAALFAMYLGFTLFGVTGLLLAPLCALVLRQFFAGDDKNKQ